MVGPKNAEYPYENGGRNAVSSINITCGGVNSHTERDTASNNHIRGNR